MVSEEELIKNGNASFIAFIIHSDFSKIKAIENLPQISTSLPFFLNGKMVPGKFLGNGGLLPNENYVINLDLLRLNFQFANDLKNFNKDLLLKIIQSSLKYTDLELHPDGVLELKLPQVSY